LPILCAPKIKKSSSIEMDALQQKVVKRCSFFVQKFCGRLARFGRRRLARVAGISRNHTSNAADCEKLWKAAPKLSVLSAVQQS
jgi:hypothetical protein